MANKEKHQAREALFDASILALFIGGIALVGAGIRHLFES